MLKNDIQEAERQFDIFIKMLRRSVVNSDKISNRLSDELEMAVQYLELEQKRLNDSFSFEIINHISGDVEIPKMLIQTHLENAVKHGIFHLKDRKGRILILINLLSERSFSIIVEDNGIGRRQSKFLKSNQTGKGLEISRQLCSLFQQYAGCSIHQSINDLEYGTQIKIIFNNYKLK